MVVRMQNSARERRSGGGGTPVKDYLADNKADAVECALTHHQSTDEAICTHRLPYGAASQVGKAAARKGMQPAPGIASPTVYLLISCHNGVLQKRLRLLRRCAASASSRRKPP